MDTPIVTKIKNGKITLPKELQAEWGNGQVVFIVSNAGFLAKSVTPPSLELTGKRVSKAARKSKITAKDVSTAVAWARKKTYAGRA